MTGICKILKEMEDNNVEFKTAGGRKTVRIFEVDFSKKTFRFMRETGKVSGLLSIEKFESFYSAFVEDKIDSDYKEIDKLLPTFGTYIVGLMEYINNRVLIKN